MAKALTKTSGYKALVKKVVQEFEELELFVKNRVAKGHWNVGKYIDEHLLENKDKPEYGTGFYEEFAEDTGGTEQRYSGRSRFTGLTQYVRRRTNWPGSTTRGSSQSRT